MNNIENNINMDEVIMRPLRPSKLKEKFDLGKFTVLVGLHEEEVEEADVDTLLYILGRRIASDLFTRNDYVTYRKLGQKDETVVFEVEYNHNAY